jgi:hypothetical protein
MLLKNKENLVILDGPAGRDELPPSRGARSTMGRYDANGELNS